MRSTIPLTQSTQNFSTHSLMSGSVDNTQKSVESQISSIHSQAQLQPTSVTDSSLIILLQNARQQQQKPNNKLSLENRAKSISQQNQLGIQQVSPSTSKQQQNHNNVLSNELSRYLPTNIVCFEFQYSIIYVF